MDLAKTYDCFPHNLLITKLETYRLDYNSPRFMLDYLTSRKQRTKIGKTYSDWMENCCKLTLVINSKLHEASKNVILLGIAIDKKTLIFSQHIDNLCRKVR